MIYVKEEEEGREDVRMGPWLMARWWDETAVMGGVEEEGDG